MQENLKKFAEQSLTEKIVQAVRIRSTHALGGGCINQAGKIETNQGDFFIKWSEQGPEDIFLREAESLEELALPKTTLKILKVYVKTTPQQALPAMLITEFLATAKDDTKHQDELLGRGIA